MSPTTNEENKPKNITIPPQKMRIVIGGFLFIERAGQWKPQYCPINGGASCSDICALFSEPVTLPNGMTLLILCKKSIVGSLEDQRLNAIPNK